MPKSLVHFFLRTEMLIFAKSVNKRRRNTYIFCRDDYLRLFRQGLYSLINLMKKEITAREEVHFSSSCVLYFLSVFLDSRTIPWVSRKARRGTSVSRMHNSYLTCDSLECRSFRESAFILIQLESYFCY